MPSVHLQKRVMLEREPGCVGTAIRATRLERERELKRLMINNYSALVNIYKKTCAIRDDIPAGITSTHMVRTILDQEFLDELD